MLRIDIIYFGIIGFMSQVNKLTCYLNKTQEAIQIAGDFNRLRHKIDNSDLFYLSGNWS